ncbi:HIT domain-containing protein [Kitasatospora purpeofusca]|uniref:HIT domain-containing protein n=1 Tax=Kitasatospora purpeofusca TaxID=67352 RepID=UPI002A59DC15|nr:HIT domain-containing protein [Kitasatospora purpeofusca]MDY0814813.1 HIT domain-containing protein [Kitasatospora purpeofusca]
MNTGSEGSVVDAACRSDLGEYRCPLCEAGRGRGAVPLDRPWLESENGVVLPALGHLLRGHLLICSKEHHPNLLSAPDEIAEELLELLDETSGRLREAFGKDCFAFEHGFVGKNTEEIGCSIDHVHLHVIPLPAGTLDLARGWLTGFTPLKESGAADRQRYLLARVGADGDWLVSPDGMRVTHRHFLKLVDEEIGRTGRYDELLGVSGHLIEQTHEALGLRDGELPIRVPVRARHVYQERLTV